MDPKTVQACQEAGIRVTPLFDGARYELPPRPLQRGLGIAMTVGGLFVTLFMLAWMAGPLSLATRTRGPMRWGLIIFGLLGLPALVMGIALTAAGNAIGRGRSRASIEISGGQFRVTEYFGPLRWIWKRPLNAVRRIRLERADATRSNNYSGVPLAMVQGAVLKVEGIGRPLLIAPLYPESVLMPLADLLTQTAAKTGVRIRNVAVGAEDSSDPAPPPKTRVTIREYREGFAIDVPPIGLLKGSHGLFLFSLFWLGICTTIFLVPWFGDGTFSSGLLPFILFGVLFIAIGLAMLGLSIHLGRRRTMLAANPQVLGLRQISPFGTQERRIPLADIASIRVGPSGMTVNDQPVIELQIFRRSTGEKIGCLSQLSEEELEWIAAVLRRRLHIGSGATQ